MREMDGPAFEAGALAADTAADAAVAAAADEVDLAEPAVSAADEDVEEDDDEGMRCASPSV